MAKNGKILAPTRTGNFFVDLNELGIIRDGCLVGGVTPNWDINVEPEDCKK